MRAGRWQLIRSCSTRAVSHESCLSLYLFAMFMPVLIQLLGMSAL